LALLAFLVLALAFLGLLGLLGLGAAQGTRLRRIGGLEVCLGGADRHPGLDRLDLGDVAGDGDLRVVLGAGLGLAVAVIGAGAFLLFGFASAFLRLALCARLRHRPLPRLLVRGVMAAPAAVLAHLDPVRRISPRLVGLVVAPLALFASQRHRNA